MNRNEMTPTPTPPSSPRTGLGVRWKLAILVVCASVLGLAISRCSRTMHPFKPGNAVDFWYAACRAQVDPSRSSRCIGPIYSARDGWFVYGGREERRIAIHGIETYRVPEDVALAHFPEVVRQCERGAHLAGQIPHHGPILDAGYRRWLAANPEKTDPHALLVCLQGAWLDHHHELDRQGERVSPATLAASAVGGWAQPDGQPWAGLLSIQEAEERLRVFRPDAAFSSVRYHRDNEKHLDQWWEQARHWHWNAVGEFGYLAALLLFAAWPWLRDLHSWRWGLHLGLLPVLFFLPYWLGYACCSSLSLGPSGGVLYPSLVLASPQLPAVPFDVWVWKLFPRVLVSWSYPVGNNGLIQTDILAGSFRGIGPGPMTTLFAGILLGLMAYCVRRALVHER
jgi:hypothetical protein